MNVWETAEAFREEVREFLDRELPPQARFDHEFTEDEELWALGYEFTRKVAQRGWIGLTWPKEYGGLGRSFADRLVLAEEIGRREAPLINNIGWGLAAGSLLAGGTHEQKLRFLPPIAKMETFWAEGLSEPDAGSDLAGLSTTASRRGDEWVINGQKTYTTWGTRADVLYLAARTDPDAPRHRGISIFCLDVHTPGVTLTPMWNIAGGRQNHTYLDDVRVPADMLIGEEGRGWDFIMRAFYESGPTVATYTVIERQLAHVVEYCRTTTRHGRKLIDDPVVRQQIAEIALAAQAERLLAWERVADAVHGRPPAFGGAIGAVVNKEHRARVAQVVSEIVGPLGFLTGHHDDRLPFGGELPDWFLRSFGNHAGGTSQVKRMVLATRGLGLPR
jgi:alkylation response protein AidB-like acyl-CoA dehydrogenase